MTTHPTLRKALRLCVSLLATVAISVGVAGPVAAAPTDAGATIAAGCYGASCNGQDPAAMGCAGDAYTPAHINTAQGFIELRYSPSCAANWGRITSSYSGQWVWVQNTFGNSYQAWVPGGGNAVWTPMVNGTVAARAGGHGGSTTWQ